MSKTMDNVKTVNSFIRTLILLAVLALLGIVGVWGYTNYIRPGLEVGRLTEELTTLKANYQKQTVKLERVETALKLMKVDRRVASIKILEMGEDEESEEPFMKVEFTELGRDGKPVCAPRTFNLRGDELYVNSLVVKFEDKYVEQAEVLRGTSLCVFRSIYGDIDGPNGGKSLDRDGIANGSIYGDGDEMSDFEKKIWEDFWDIANDEDRQDEMGIRAIHGEAPYTKVKPGMTYRVELRSSGGVSLDPEKTSDE